MLHVTHLLHILYWIKIWTPRIYPNDIKNISQNVCIYFFDQFIFKPTVASDSSGFVLSSENAPLRFKKHDLAGGLLKSLEILKNVVEPDRIQNPVSDNNGPLHRVSSSQTD